MSVLPLHGALIKRAMDVVVGGLLALLTLPLLLALGGLIRAVDHGPVFFRQGREGVGGAMFTMWKLRTMRVDADARLEALLAADPAAADEWRRYRRLRNDPRLIPLVGKFLRRFSLDELPQLWHVVAGEMSLVGPRPLELEVARGIAPGLGELRRSVRPGLTGLWQVTGRSDMDLDQIPEVDAHYVHNWSLGLELAILLRTPHAVWSGRGAY